MAVYSFHRVLVWDNLGGSVKVARNTTVRVSDPDTGAFLQSVTSDAQGAVSLTLQIPVARFTGPNGYWFDVISPDAYAEATVAAARAETAEASAQSSADSAAASAALVGAPSKAAMDAAMGGDVAGLVPAVASSQSTAIAAQSAADAATDLALTPDPTATVTHAVDPASGASYQLIRIYSGGRPRVARHHYADNYETSGTSGTNFKPPRKPIIDLAKQAGATVAINASGFQQSGNVGELRGVQIKDGIAYHDFEPAGTGLGEYALGFHADGSARVYSVNWGDTAASMVAAGVIDTFGFGPALVVDGVKQDLTSRTALSGRSCLGIAPNGDLLILSAPGVTNSYGIMEKDLTGLAIAVGMVQGVSLDGGGSAQVAVNGSWTQRSSDTDPRDVPDILAVRANVASPANTAWRPFPPAAGYQHGSPAAEWQLRDGVLYTRGAIAATSGNIPTGSSIILSDVVPELTGIAANNTAGAAVGVGGQPVGKLWIQSGALRCQLLTGTATSYLALKPLSGAVVT